MAPSIETRIFEAIKARVEALPMASSYDVAWTSGETTLVNGSGSPYTPVPTKRYLRCTFTPNATQRPLIGSRERNTRPGILQIDVMGTVAQGAGVAREAAGQLAQHFPADRKLTFMGTKVRITKDPTVYRPIVGTHIQVPVEILLAYE